MLRGIEPYGLRLCQPSCLSAQHHSGVIRNHRWFSVAKIAGARIYNQYTFPRNLPTNVIICRIWSIGSVGDEDAYLLCIDSTGKVYAAITEKNASSVTWRLLAFA